MSYGIALPNAQCLYYTAQKEPRRRICFDMFYSNAGGCRGI